MQPIKYFLLILSAVFLMIVIQVYAFTEPASAPPASNLFPPLNTGPTGQYKSGGLSLNSGGASNGLLVVKGSVGMGISPDPLAQFHIASTTPSPSFPMFKITAGANALTVNDTGNLEISSNADGLIKFTRQGATSPTYFNLGLDNALVIQNSGIDTLILKDGSLGMKPPLTAPGVSPLTQGRIYFDSASNKFKVSENGGAYADLVSGGSGLTNGLIAYYNGITCPAGWSAVTGAEGRYIIGFKSSVTAWPPASLGAQVGTALGDQENRAVGAHTHNTAGGVFHTSLPPGGTLLGGSGFDVGWSPITGGVSGGAVSGTPAPYIQYLVCQYVGTGLTDNSKWGSDATNLWNLNSGNVGIGTAAPAYKLHVAGDINFTGTLRQNGTPFSGGGSTSRGRAIGRCPTNMSFTSGTIVDLTGCDTVTITTKQAGSYIRVSGIIGYVGAHSGAGGWWRTHIKVDGISKSCQWEKGADQGIHYDCLTLSTYSVGPHTVSLQMDLQNTTGTNINVAGNDALGFVVEEMFNE